MSFQQHQPRSKVIFVGNLPFDYTEEQLSEVFSSVGPVVSFRLVFDHASGKPKGYGFCEYGDQDTAASALRNLQGVEVAGRQLRLDFADTEDAKRHIGRPLPPGTPIQNGMSATDSISQTLAKMPPGQLLEMMGQMKNMVSTQPTEARALFSSNPQLSYAIFQALLMMDLIDPATLQRVLPNTGSPAPKQAPQQVPQQAPPPQQNYNAPPPIADQQALINQVLQMTQEQIDAMPAESRNTILQIRAQAMASLRR